MATSTATRFLCSLTLQSHRQRKVQGHRLAAHPTNALSLSLSTNSTRSSSPETAPEEHVNLLPDPANWDDFDHDLNPRNWSVRKKILATTLVTQISWLVQFASAIDASVTEGIEKRFDVNSYVSALATGLFLVGCGLGAPIAGPLSESTGRNPVYIMSLFCFLISELIAALAPHLHWFLLARLAAGFFGSTPLVCAGGSINDLWNPRDQLIAFPLYAAGGFSGLAAGPAAGYIMGQGAGSGIPQMTEWTTLLLGGIVFLMIVLFQPETYAPILLKWKTCLIIDSMKDEERNLIFPPHGNTSIGHNIEVTSRTLWLAFKRPIIMAVKEPIICALSLNLSMIYLIVFTVLPGYHTIFIDIYHFQPAAFGATFYSLAIGMLLGVWFAIGLASYWRRHHVSPSLAGFDPEARLDYSYLGGPAIAISLWWLGFTARAGISPWSPIMASVLLGFGVLCVFLSSYMYIIHSYGKYAASGLVFITLVRYLAAGGMVVAGVAMFEHIGVRNTFAILGTVAALLVPVPFLLFRFGYRLRMKSTFTAGTM